MSTQLPENFDPESQDGNSWELLPVGEYVAQIVEASVMQPKNLDGYYVALTWKISEGEYEGRQVWQRITYIHSSEQAQTIGRKTLKDLCTALGVNEHVEDVELFLFKPAKIKVGIEKDQNGQYDDKNVVKRIMPLETPDDTPAQPTSTKPGPKSSTPAVKPAATNPQPAKPAAARPAPAGQAPWHADGGRS
jgi:Protein of unknown function (DUF669)